MRSYQDALRKQHCMTAPPKALLFLEQNNYCAPALSRAVDFSIILFCALLQCAFGSMCADFEAMQ